ncbi:hypothetical protein IAT40_001000 [Kwoniella sp. CBS 6097]
MSVQNPSNDPKATADLSHGSVVTESGMGLTLNLYAIPKASLETSRQPADKSRSSAPPDYQILPDIKANETAISRKELEDSVAKVIHTTLTSINDYLLQSTEGAAVHHESGTFVPTTGTQINPNGTQSTRIQIGEHAQQKLRNAVKPLFQSSVDTFERTTGNSMASEIVFGQPPTRGPMETAMQPINVLAGPPSWKRGTGLSQSDHIPRQGQASNQGSGSDGGGSEVGFPQGTRFEYAPSNAGAPSERDSDFGGDDDVYSDCGEWSEIPDLSEQTTSQHSGSNSRRDLTRRSEPEWGTDATSVRTSHWLEDLHSRQR